MCVCVVNLGLLRSFSCSDFFLVWGHSLCVWVHTQTHTHAHPHTRTHTCTHLLIQELSELTPRANIAKILAQFRTSVACHVWKLGSWTHFLEELLEEASGDLVIVLALLAQVISHGSELGRIYHAEGV